MLMLVNVVGDAVLLAAHCKTCYQVDSGLLLYLFMVLSVILPLPRHVVGSMMDLSWDMNHLKVEPQGFLFQHQESRIVNVCQGLVIEDAQQWFGQLQL